MTAQDVFAAALHSVPLDYAVSEFTAAASAPHTPYGALWSGSFLTGRTLRNVTSFASLYKGCGVHGVEPLVALRRVRNFTGARGRSHQLIVLPFRRRKPAER